MYYLLGLIDTTNYSYLGLSILLLNIISYLIVFLILIALILMCNLSKLKTLNQFKEFNSYSFIHYTIVFSLISLAGIPPLLGFSGKFLAILFASLKSQYVIIILMTLLNIFAMYFYIQNLRFVVKKTKSNILIYKNYYVNINYSLITNIIIFNFFNIFGILFLSDFLIIITNITSNIYI